jgi:PhzF family phenazine biosynthesis protein
MMMKIPTYQVDAFTGKVFKGNPAAVCPLEHWIEDQMLQNIALENNLSETAFFVRKEDYFEIRWFTPKVEVNLCGHATLASAHVIFRHLGFKEEEIIFQSKSGILKVHQKGDSLVLDFPASKITSAIIKKNLSKALGKMPVAVYQSGKKLLALYEDEATIAGIQPDFEILKSIDYMGFIVTAPGDKVDFVSRFFAPRVGINEDPVTGSAHTILIPFWAERLGKTKLKALQISSRIGELDCELKGDRVMIGGQAVTYLIGEIEVEV